MMKMKKNMARYACVHTGITLLYARNEHNSIVSQLQFEKEWSPEVPFCRAPHFQILGRPRGEVCLTITERKQQDVSCNVVELLFDTKGIMAIN